MRFFILFFSVVLGLNPLQAQNEQKSLILQPFVQGAQAFKVNGLKARDMTPLRVSTLKAAPTKPLLSLLILIETNYRFGVAVNALSNKEKHQIIEQRFYEHLQDAQHKGSKTIMRKVFRHTESLTASEKTDQQKQYTDVFKKATAGELKAVMGRLKRSLVGTFLNRPLLARDDDFMTPEAAKNFTPRLIKKLREASGENTTKGQKGTLLSLVLIQHALEGHNIKNLSPERRIQKANSLYVSFATRMGFKQGELSEDQNAAMVETVITNIERLTGLKELYARRPSPKNASRKA